MKGIEWKVIPGSNREPLLGGKVIFARRANSKPPAELVVRDFIILY